MAFNQTAKSVLASKEDGRGYLDSLTNKYIVKPKNAKGIGGFVFDFEGETQVSHQADITDHYAENNEVINDHVARRPARVTLRGFQAELILKKPNALTGLVNSLQNKLTVVPAYLGKYTPQALAKAQAVLTQTQQTINKINTGMARVQNVVGFFSKATPGDSKQKKAYNQLFTLFQNTEIFTVETPYGYFDKMVIESLAFIQPEETKGWSDITVTLKQMRFVEVSTETATSATFGGRAQEQRQSNSDKGKTKGDQRGFTTLFSFLPKSLQSLVP